MTKPGLSDTEPDMPTGLSDTELAIWLRAAFAIERARANELTQELLDTHNRYAIESAAREEAERQAEWAEGKLAEALAERDAAREVVYDSYHVTRSGELIRWLRQLHGGAGIPEYVDEVLVRAADSLEQAEAERDALEKQCDGLRRTLFDADADYTRRTAALAGARMALTNPRTPSLTVRIAHALEAIDSALAHPTTEPAKAEKQP